jgi:hypothetical protein
MVGMSFPPKSTIAVKYEYDPCPGCTPPPHTFHAKRTAQILRETREARALPAVTAPQGMSVPDDHTLLALMLATEEMDNALGWFRKWTTGDYRVSTWADDPELAGHYHDAMERLPDFKAALLAAITAVTKPALTRIGSGLYEVPPAVTVPQGVRDFEVEVVRGVEGAALYFNNYRVAGSKPWGGGTLLHTFKVKWSDVKSSGILAFTQPALTPTPVDDSLAADSAVKPEMVSFSREVTDQLMAEVAKGPQGYFPRQPTLAEALVVLVDCVEDGCYCSEERMAAAVSEARAALRQIGGEE